MPAAGDAISPTVIGFVADLTGVQGADGKIIPNRTAGFLAVSGMILLGGVLWMIGAKHLARDTANAPHRTFSHDPPVTSGWSAAR